MALNPSHGGANVWAIITLICIICSSQISLFLSFGCYVLNVLLKHWYQSFCVLIGYTILFAMQTYRELQLEMMQGDDVPFGENQTAISYITHFLVIT